MNLAEYDGLTPELHNPEPDRSMRPVWFLLPFLLGPLLIIAAGIWIIPTRWFALHSANTYMVNLAYADTLKNSACEVVIYGDSTTLTGIDVPLVQRRTGLKTCNIAEFGGMTQVNGFMLVDHYLAHNPRPRFMIFDFGPENFRSYASWNKTSPFEAIAWRLGQPITAQTVWLMLKHPMDVITWTEQGTRMAVMRVHSKPMGAESLNLRARYGGSFPTEGTTLTHCDPGRFDVAPDPAWVANLHTKYGVDGTTVILNANPAPPCEASLAFFQQHLTPYIDDKPYPVWPGECVLWITAATTSMPWALRCFQTCLPMKCWRACLLPSVHRLWQAARTAGNSHGGS